jgi:hypothetical protein
MGCCEECALCCCRMEYSIDSCHFHKVFGNLILGILCWFMSEWPIYCW